MSSTARGEAHATVTPAWRTATAACHPYPAGMHWTVAGADAIIALRCCKLSNRFEDFWERRAQRRVAA